MYAVQASPPFAVLNVSHPFRLRLLNASSTPGVHRVLGPSFAPRKGYHSREGRPFDEEKIQFVSGFVRLDEAHVLLSYGVNDCVAVTRQLAVSEVFSLLERRWAPEADAVSAVPSANLTAFRVFV